MKQKYAKSIFLTVERLVCLLSGKLYKKHVQTGHQKSYETNNKNPIKKPDEIGFCHLTKYVTAVKISVAAALKLLTGTVWEYLQIQQDKQKDCLCT